MTDAAAEGGEKKQNVILSFVMHPKNEDLVIITTNNFFSPPEGLFTNPALIGMWKPQIRRWDWSIRFRGSTPLVFKSSILILARWKRPSILVGNRQARTFR